MILLTFRDLGYRFVRFVVVVVLAAVVFALLFLMTGLVEQFHREPYDATAAIGGSAWVLADGVSGPFTASSSLPVSELGALDADVKAPVVSARSSLEHDGATQEIVVLGHARYYQRFGFAPASTFGLRCEYDVPDEVFMVRELLADVLRGVSGTVRYHEVFSRF